MDRPARSRAGLATLVRRRVRRRYLPASRSQEDMVDARLRAGVGRYDRVAGRPAGSRRSDGRRLRDGGHRIVTRHDLGAVTHTYVRCEAYPPGRSGQGRDVTQSSVPLERPARAAVRALGHHPRSCTVVVAIPGPAPRRLARRPATIGPSAAAARVLPPSLPSDRRGPVSSQISRLVTVVGRRAGAQVALVGTSSHENYRENYRAGKPGRSRSLPGSDGHSVVPGQGKYRAVVVVPGRSL